MSNFKLDSNHDIAIEGVNPNLVLINGVEAIAQDCETRLNTVLGEYFLDRRIGVPYFQKILGQKPRLNIVRSLLRKAILTTPGITNIIDFVLVFDGKTRATSLNFRGETIEGPFVYNKDLII